jgi:hypothetical protein
MITNFVIHDGALRPRVIRARAPFAVIPAAARSFAPPGAAHLPLDDRFRHGRPVGQLDRGGVRRRRFARHQAGHCSRPKAAADIAAVVCFGIFQRIAGGLNRGGPIERRP